MPITITSTLELAQQRILILVYGLPGVGKTTLAKTCPGRVLIVSAESGLLSLAGTEIDVVEITSWRELTELFTFLDQEETKATYQWIFVDSLSELGQRLVEHLKSKYPDRSDGLKLWGEYNDSMMAFVKAVRDFKPYSVIFTALVSTDKDDLNRTRYGVDLNGKIAARLPAYFDEVFAMRTFQGDEGKTFRGLQTQENDGWIAKDRSGRLELIEPPSIETITQKILNPNQNQERN